ncbi:MULTISPECIES: hypothetical protein [unclassified Flagellimonas]|uniref:Uncharacterized protein n=1 Tax=Flagellimonas sp. MMG031 TaxID=3158549 RepID=A0AAU7MU27_9FLAO
MIYLLWSLINVFLPLYFFYLHVNFLAKGKRFFNPKYKTFQILFLVIGVTQIIVASSTEKANQNIYLKDDHANFNSSKMVHHMVEDNWTMNIHFLLEYSVQGNKYIPLKSSSFLSGFVSGYDWELLSVDGVGIEDGRGTVWYVSSNLQWKLLGLPFTVRTKYFK